MPVRRTATTTAAVGATAVAVLVGCTTSPDPEQTRPLAWTVPKSPLVCDFVPKASVVRVLGTDAFTADGRVVEGDGLRPLSSAGCAISREGDVLPSIIVTTNWLLGLSRQGFERGLTDSDKLQLPRTRGLGFGYTQQQESKDGEATVGRATVARGDYLISVQLVPAEGRDPAQDALRLAHQAVTVLDLPGRWTLDGDPPTRPATSG